MECKEIMEELQSRASEKYKANVVRMEYRRSVVSACQRARCGRLQKKPESPMNWRLNCGTRVIMSKIAGGSCV